MTQFEKTYLPVLTQILKGDITETEKSCRLQDFHNIIGLIINFFKLLFITSLAVLLDIKKEVMDYRLYVLHSVLRVPTNPKISVRLFYLSFRDFLIDPERRYSQFWVNKKQTHKNLAARCLNLLLKTACLKQNICAIKPGSLRTNINNQLIKQCLSAEVQYACCYWVHHLEQVEYRISDLD